MLYRPKFCAECGEKIERSKWGIFTSRRFCIVCETQNKGADLIPVAIALAGLILFVTGASGIFRSNQPQSQIRSLVKTPTVEEVSQTTERRLTSQPQISATEPSQSIQSQQTLRPTDAVPRLKTSDSGQPAVRDQETIRAESVYVCGAETKKGTPCSRRVKGRGRCFQHKGMPAMMDETKLRVE